MLAFESRNERGIGLRRESGWWMSRSLLASLALSAPLAAACQWVGGFDKRDVDPALYAQDPEPPGCKFPGEGEAAVRFANLNPSAGGVHLCIKPSQTPAWPSRPITKGVGQDCPRLVSYKDVAAPRPVATGTYDLKVIQADAPDCSAPSLTETSGIAFSKASTITAIYTRHADELLLLTMPEAPPNATSTLARFVNLMGGVDSFDVHLAKPGAWPPDPGVVAVQNLSFGKPAGAENEGTIGPITAAGYLDFFVAGAHQTFGAKRKASSADGGSDGGADGGSSSQTWLAVVNRKWTGQKAFSVFAAGTTDDPEYPPRVARLR